MSYIRPKSDINLTPNEKRELLHGYFEHYREIARVNPDLLNAKIPRHVFDRLLNEIGALVLEFANSAAEKEGEVKEFISMNPLPPKMDELLPENFRAGGFK